MTSDKRVEIFDIYSKNYSVFTSLTESPIKDVYVCPLCLRQFTRDDAITGKRLTLEHVLPRALGGAKSDCVLTCQQCNNTSGIIEGKFVTSRKTRDVLAGNSTAFIPVVLSKVVDGELIELRAKYRITDDQNEIVVIPQQNHPLFVERMAKSGFPEGEEFNLRFDIEDLRHGSPSVTLLKVAYLRLFQLLGYAPILSANMDVVRQQISQPKSELLQAYVHDGVSVPDNALGLLLVKVPPSLRCYQVAFDIEVADIKTRVRVLLPNPDNPGLAIYDTIRELGSEIQEVNGVPIRTNPEWLYEKGFVQEIDRLWEYV